MPRSILPNIAGAKEESAAMPKISNNLSGERGSA
jgi:hypothetical protein